MTVNGLSNNKGWGAGSSFSVGCQKAPGLMVCTAWRRSSWRSCAGPPRFRWNATAATAPAMSETPMQAPSRCAAARMGSSPAKETEPPVSVRERLTSESRSSRASTGSKSVDWAVGVALEAEAPRPFADSRGRSVTGKLLSFGRRSIRSAPRSAGATRSQRAAPGRNPRLHHRRDSSTPGCHCPR